MITPYVYLIKNKITNQFYYGSRAGNVRLKKLPIDDLWVIYFTSSKKVKSLIEQYGKESFEIEIIFYDMDYDICYWKEQELIKDSKSNPLCINGTYIDPDTKIRKFSIFGRDKELEIERGKAISISKKGKSNGHEGFVHSEKTKQKMRESQRELGYKHTEESKSKMKEYKRTAEHATKLGDSLRGKPWSEARWQAYLRNKENGSTF